MTLEEILLHKRTQAIAARLGNGENPKTIAASLAGDLVSEHLAKLLKIDAPKAKVEAKVVAVKPVQKDDDIVDAEFREVK